VCVFIGSLIYVYLLLVWFEFELHDENEILEFVNLFLDESELEIVSFNDND